MPTSNSTFGGRLLLVRPINSLWRKRILSAIAISAIAAFASPPPAVAALSGPDFPVATVDTATVTDYRIGPLDKLNVTVFQVKELTVENLQVDASGQILLPLIGTLQAQGKTTAELSNEIADKLKEHYLQSPQVSVMVADTASQKVTVEGAVNDAGVFEMKGRTSLLEAVARAKGLAKAANSHRVSIVRSIDGVPHAATFDLAAISAGKARNPEVIANDVVIVDSARSKSIWHGMVEMMPALYLLTFL
jgi:polysaccharide export outer membrane protein